MAGIEAAVNVWRKFIEAIKKLRGNVWTHRRNSTVVPVQSCPQTFSRLLLSSVVGLSNVFYFPLPTVIPLLFQITTIILSSFVPLSAGYPPCPIPPRAASQQFLPPQKPNIFPPCPKAEAHPSWPSQACARQRPRISAARLSSTHSRLSATASSLAAFA